MLVMAPSFKIELEGVGAFLFRDKTLRDQVRIEAAASETLGRVPSSLRPDETGIGNVALALAHVTVLLVEAPAGWSAEALDPLSDEDVDQLMVLYRRLVEQLARFRAERKQKSLDVRAGAV